ncbi:MAG TPA: acyl-CoA dehydrogenase family protein [Acidimicrobiales bacterium]|nr:acyl-CoA dehydrogenase family protein [Acidimicrobiales bacterium]
MDFSFSEEQTAVVEAAEKLFTGHLTDERRAQVQAADEGIDRDLWAALADANLLGLAVDESDGGSGYGFAEVAILLEQAGLAAAPVPLWASLVLGGLPVAAYGSESMRRELLAPLCNGTEILTAALTEVGSRPTQPLTTARKDANGWILHGSKTCVPAGLIADHVLVPATTGEGEVTIFVVDPRAAGVERTRLETTTGIPEARIDLDGAVVGDDRILGGQGGGREILEWLLPRATAGLCSLMAGTCKAAVDLTATYAAGRQQFGRIIATFQAVGQRAADAYIDAEAVQLTARQAVWRLSDGRDADEQVAIAKFWAAEGGQRVVHAAQHIHGGVGVDRSYPLHRYFLAAKQLELTLGGATQSLVGLGAMMAARPA